MSGFYTRLAERSDLIAVVGVQKRAFERVAQELGIEPQRLPPLSETVEDLQGLMEAGTLFFVAVSFSDTIIGSVRATRRGDCVEIGRLVVDDGWLRRGVASALMDLLERTLSECARFELFTGADAAGPLALYASRGYQQCRRERLQGVDLVWLERRLPPEVR